MAETYDGDPRPKVTVEDEIRNRMNIPVPDRVSVAVANAAAATAAAFPAGGTGAAAGGWDTAGNRDLAITRFTALLTDVADLRTQFNALLAELRNRKIIT